MKRRKERTMPKGVERGPYCHSIPEGIDGKVLGRVDKYDCML